ncbi:ABC transporter ATP-binding protein [Acidocella sp.]|uniref:dipeptide ABC transporter ATP-binding protein n=1 Tax=Acidocella sp. TaxID=50710 RepID=UPI0026290FB0|nr:ABC transporter ATP-binding protein [Acidocella sp.]
MSPVLDIRDVSVSLRRNGQDVVILEELNLTIAPGEMLGLVGESGSGKTIAALAIMRLLPAGAKIHGEILLSGENLARAPEARMRSVRGKAAGMVFQNPLAALNPSRTVAAQICEAWRVHQGGGKAQARAKALELLREVGIPNPEARLDDYPHQFSGGMRQRVVIAMALACSPQLLIADEPTTGLDPLIARQIMNLITRLRRERNMAVLFVTHDISVVQEHADTIHVLYAGRSVEWGAAPNFFIHPRHPYSEALLGAVARLGQKRLQNIPGNLPEPESRPPGCRFAPRCTYAQQACNASYPLPDAGAGTVAACLYPLPAAVRAYAAAETPNLKRRFPPLLKVDGLTVRYGGARSWFGERRKQHPSLADVTLSLGKGECLGVVGESGSGKSTLGRAVLQMIQYEGRVLMDGRDFRALSGRAKRDLRRKVQVVFQDPRESMNPRMSVGEIIAEPLILAGQRRGDMLHARVRELLDQVGLNPEMAARFPSGISGGQAQRIAIARALAAEPSLIILDEPTSALDLSTQAMLLNLLKELSFRNALSYVLISHDFAVVSYLADRIAVLNAGRIVEVNETSALIASPQHEYTAALVNAAPQFQFRPAQASS